MTPLSTYSFMLHATYFMYGWSISVIATVLRIVDIQSEKESEQKIEPARGLEPGTIYVQGECCNHWITSTCMAKKQENGLKSVSNQFFSLKPCNNPMSKNDYSMKWWLYCLCINTLKETFCQDPGGWILLLTRFSHFTRFSPLFNMTRCQIAKSRQYIGNSSCRLALYQHINT